MHHPWGNGAGERIYARIDSVAYEGYKRTTVLSFMQQPTRRERLITSSAARPKKRRTQRKRKPGRLRLLAETAASVVALQLFSSLALLLKSKANGRNAHSITSSECVLRWPLAGAAEA